MVLERDLLFLSLLFRLPWSLDNTINLIHHIHRLLNPSFHFKRERKENHYVTRARSNLTRAKLCRPGSGKEFRETRERGGEGTDVNNKCESRGNNVIMGSATCDTRAIFSLASFDERAFSSLGSSASLSPKRRRGRFL